jgi:hypothetical protein
MAEAGEQGLYPGWVGAGVAPGMDALVGQIGTPGAGDEQLTPEAGINIDERDFGSAPASLYSGDHAGRAGSDNSDGSEHVLILALKERDGGW